MLRNESPDPLIDCAQADIRCAREDHFLEFIKRYNVQDKMLTNNKLVTNEIIKRYIVYFLGGVTIKNEKNG